VCGLVQYPKISPVVIVGVTNGEKILVTRYKEGSFRDYALVAGFVEIGESLEDAARREVFEETGVHIKNLKYYKSQPWGFSSSILSGFFCQLDGDPTITMDKNELSEAIWLSYNDLPPADANIALTMEMMEVFRTGQWRIES
jgi:NAD+ diphosphatase